MQVKFEDSTTLHCTHPGCKASEAKKTFIGRGARTAHKRHMDIHNKPYLCPFMTCKRHTEGFSRKDNRNHHVKSHDREGGNSYNPKKRRTKNHMKLKPMKHAEAILSLLKDILEELKDILEEMEMEKEGDPEKDAKRDDLSPSSGI
ncbi:hypothetical protein FPQ18DRAFT_377294 [Pyronema domesticum]|nr:hypothetical protein FPQ18DRAFT_377294 [Pyronema domesticum]